MNVQLIIPNHLSYRGEVTMNVRLIIPNRFLFQNINDCVHETDVHHYLKKVANIAGGYTCYRGHGGWIDSKGVLVEEPVTIVNCSPEDGHYNPGPVAALFRQLARTIALDLSQECVFLSIDGKAEFIRP
jgi:hypothetical protein